jgi:hypothetical protein
MKEKVVLAILNGFLYLKARFEWLNRKIWAKSKHNFRVTYFISH